MTGLKAKMIKGLPYGLPAKLIAIAFLSLPINAIAESAPIRVSDQVQQAVEKPRHGQSMQHVENIYGPPVEKVAAVGEPPISRWRYNNFTVYFEHDKVIHSVAHRS